METFKNGWFLWLILNRYDFYCSNIRVAAFELKKNRPLQRYHTGAFGLVEKNHWSCCNLQGFTAEGCTVHVGKQFKGRLLWKNHSFIFLLQNDPDLDWCKTTTYFWKFSKWEVSELLGSPHPFRVLTMADVLTDNIVHIISHLTTWHVVI